MSRFCLLIICGCVATVVTGSSEEVWDLDSVHSIPSSSSHGADLNTVKYSDLVANAEKSENNRRLEQNFRLFLRGGLMLILAAIVFYLKDTTLAEFEQILPASAMASISKIFGGSSGANCEAVCVSRYGDSNAKVAVAETAGYAENAASSHKVTPGELGSVWLATGSDQQATDFIAQQFDQILQEKVQETHKDDPQDEPTNPNMPPQQKQYQPNEDDLKQAVAGVAEKMKEKNGKKSEADFCGAWFQAIMKETEKEDKEEEGEEEEEEAKVEEPIVEKYKVNLVAVGNVKAMVFGGPSGNAKPKFIKLAEGSQERLPVVSDSKMTFHTEEVEPGSIVLLASTDWWWYAQQLAEHDKNPESWENRLWSLVKEKGADYAAEYLTAQVAYTTHRAGSIAIMELDDGSEWQGLPREMTRTGAYRHPTSFAQKAISKRYLKFFDKCSFPSEELPAHSATRWFRKMQPW